MQSSEGDEQQPKSAAVLQVKPKVKRRSSPDVYIHHRLSVPDVILNILKDRKSRVSTSEQESASPDIDVQGECKEDPFIREPTPVRKARSFSRKTRPAPQPPKAMADTQPRTGEDVVEMACEGIAIGSEVVGPETAKAEGIPIGSEVVGPETAKAAPKIPKLVLDKACLAEELPSLNTPCHEEQRSSSLEDQGNLSSSSTDATSTSTSEDTTPPLSTSPSILPTMLRKLSFLARSSSYTSSAKSAPTTPQGEWCAPPSPVNSPPKSPSHRHDKHGVKQLSQSAPGMTQAPRPQSAGEPAASATPTAGAATTPTPAPEEPGSSKSRQKKFHRHFKMVAQEERVLNYYSCALVADILLQGHLYITKNYFAFYSNVFGYVTKVLIPTVSVLKISKEKTARIIPNAVGVTTLEDKHVFGSLLSRDSTYRLMTQVWKAAIGPDPLIVLPVIKDVADDIETSSGRFINIHEDDESSLSGSERSIAPTPTPTDISHTDSVCARELTARGLSGIPMKEKILQPKKAEMSRPTTLLLVSTALLVFLFLSAAFLLYRISLIQNQFIGNPLITSSDQVYQEILKWQAQLHSRSANEVQEFLSSNLDQLAKVRKSLEALSLLLLRNEEYARTVRGRQQEYDASFLHNGNS